MLVKDNHSVIWVIPEVELFLTIFLGQCFGVQLHPVSLYDVSFKLYVT